MDNTNKDELNKENKPEKVDFYIYEAKLKEKRCAGL